MSSASNDHDQHPDPNDQINQSISRLITAVNNYRSSAGKTRVNNRIQPPPQATSLRAKATGTTEQYMMKSFPSIAGKGGKLSSKTVKNNKVW